VCRISALYIYPIKGMQGMSVREAKVLERGFAGDRRYMLVDEKGTFLSQRTHPQLVFFYPTLQVDTLTVKYRDQVIHIPLDQSMGNHIQTTIFEQKVSATEVDPTVNDWFSTMLNQQVRLVKMEPQNVRYKKLIKGPKQVEVSFADGYPYLIIGTESLKALNRKMENQVEMNRFRPNIVVDTDEAQIEDTWEEIQIRKIKFLVVKPCARCQVVTIDQSTGQKSTEPLKTLSTYQKRDNQIYFGVNAIGRKEGKIRIDDEVVVL